jgi:endonuclease/exonuclease/phosphatase (EEP) superfamily protein YafD
VVLVGPGVQVQDAVSSHFSVNLSFPVAGAIPITIFRSWNRVDLKHRGRELTFVNTHPETDEASVAVQEAQAQELIGLLANADRPTIVVGDLNGTPAGTQTYGFFQTAGFVDAWTEAHPGEDGFTCCFAPDLSGGTLFERIDYVLARGSAKEAPLVGRVRLVGDGPNGSGVLASDHAGIVADVGFAKERGGQNP